MQIDESRKVEQRLEALARESLGDRRQTDSLLRELNDAIQTKTFNSATLLRLKTEALLAAKQRDEAVAAFKTYVELQKLSLYKQRSGAAALPDTWQGTTQLFSMVFTLLESEGVLESLKVVVKFGDMLNELLEESPVLETNTLELVAPVMARARFAQMVTAQGDPAYQVAEKASKEWFEKINVQQCRDSPCLFNYALFEALVGSPTTAFVLAKKSLELDPHNLRSALLLVQLLTTNDTKLGDALELASSYLGQHPQPVSMVEKLTLLQLKKTEIALIEKLRGRDAALGELEGFIETASVLYADETGSKRTPMRIETRRTFFGLKRQVSSALPPVSRKTSSRSIAAVDRGQPQPQQQQQQKDQQPQQQQQSAVAAAAASNAASGGAPIEHRELASCWMWIALQYAKFDLEVEALEALQEAKEMWPNAQNIRGIAHSEALLGHVCRERDPKKALEHYRNSLACHSMHISSAVSATRIVCNNLEELDKDKELATLLLGFLESICARAPGRFLAETWYSRALLHEALNGTDSAHDLYWQAVRLEERRAVTSYLMLNAAV